MLARPGVGDVELSLGHIDRAGRPYPEWQSGVHLLMRFLWPPEWLCQLLTGQISIKPGGILIQENFPSLFSADLFDQKVVGLFSLQNNDGLA